MSNTKIQFISFLSDLKIKLNEQGQKWFVIGNESSDLDSVVGSLVYSYLKQLEVGSQYQVFPIISIDYKNLILKQDVLLWLKKFQIEANDHLIFMENIDFNQFNCQITLINNHNSINDHLSKFVKEIINKRFGSVEYPPNQLSKKIIQHVGSCCTLIAKLVLQSSTTSLCTDTLLEMLYGPILLNTNRLRVKVTNEDENIVAGIEEKLGFDEEIRFSVFKELKKAKMDISDLTIPMMFERDMKMIKVKWHNTQIKLTISSLIKLDIEELLNEDYLEKTLLDLSNQLKVQMIIGLTKGTKDLKRRGYLFYSLDNDLQSELIQFLSKLDQFNITLLPSSPINSLVCFLESGGSTTRKQFIRYLEQFFNNHTSTVNDSIAIQINNFNENLFSSQVNEGGDGAEVDDFRDTLNTPKRSCNESPIEGETELTIPSLNNRRTMELVDRKRQKHTADFEMETDDKNELEIANIAADNVIEKEDVNNDHPSPPFTPENSDEDSDTEYSADSDSKRDIIGPLPSMNNALTIQKIKTKRMRLNHQFDDEHNNGASGGAHDASNNGCEKEMSGNENPFTPNNSICEDITNKFDFLDTESSWDGDTLTNKVNEKRQKLESDNYFLIATNLVHDAIYNSINYLNDEEKHNRLLKDWSTTFTDDEKQKLFVSINKGDVDTVAHLLTTSVLRDSKAQLAGQMNILTASNNGKENNRNNNAITTTNVLVAEDNFVNEDETVEEDNEEQNAGYIDLEINYNRCPIETVLNENQNNHTVITNCIKYSSSDVVENTSYNLYRRISSNGTEFTEEEKQLMEAAGSLCFDDYRDELNCIDEQVKDTATLTQSSNTTELESENKLKKLHPQLEISFDTSNVDPNNSTDMSLNDGDTIITPDICAIDELEVLEFSQNSPSQTPGYAAGDLPVEGNKINEPPVHLDNTELISSHINWDYDSILRDCGHYFDDSNNQEKTEIIALYSCFLPSKSDDNYTDIMQYLFDYIQERLEHIDCTYYTIVYFHCYGIGKKAPTLGWLKQCYQVINYKLKKNLKHLYIVHPTIWFRGMVFFSRLLINTKFYQKIHYVSQLEKLNDFIPTSSIPVPTQVLQSKI